MLVSKMILTKLYMQYMQIENSKVIRLMYIWGEMPSNFNSFDILTCFLLKKNIKNIH